MKPTIYDVAKAAGVSIATVSKVINNTGRISEKTRKLVLNIMKEMNYQPSVVASALTGKSTYTIGLMIPDLANPFFSGLARSIEDHAHVLGYNIVICSTDYEPDKEAKYISLLLQKSVDGIILASGFENIDAVKELIKQKVPLAILAREIPSLEVDTVAIDDCLGGYQAASHLIGLGHKKIAIIARDLWSNRERMRGYRLALDEAGISYGKEVEYVRESNVESGKQLAEKLLRSEDPPTAIFACNDLLAVGAIQAARERGMSVPADLSIVGFDNTVWASAIDPPLTTVAQPIRDMGTQVMNLLVQEINGQKKYKQRIMLLPELVVRGSTAKHG
ncbi:LacI family DNA-binding transcriptional regulator [Brevibacillus sp. B_LB10_24]|uniref:LacI family DNA-binding transcriptional regulator n=1 Tax=Brevibacillus sp. B_LB10_24 TaxID=3380645 RepID=UPI0038B6E311